MRSGQLTSTKPLSFVPWIRTGLLWLLDLDWNTLTSDFSLENLFQPCYKISPYFGFQDKQEIFLTFLGQTRPLDVSTFSPLEKRIQLLSHRWHSDPTKVGRKLDQYSMMKIVVYEAVQQVFSKRETVISGFRRTGLVPWRKLDPEHLKKFLTSALCQRLPLLVIQNLFLQLLLIVPASDDVLDTEAIPVPDTDSSPASESALSSSALFSSAPSYSAPSTSTPCSSTSSYISAAEMVREAPSTSMSREASASSTATLPLYSDPTYDILVAEQSKLSQEDKVWLLKRHELLLGPPKVKCLRTFSTAQTLSSKPGFYLSSRLLG